MTNIKKDLSVLTSVSESTFSKLEEKIVWCISDAVEDATINDLDHVDVDLGFGVLTIKIDTDTVKYLFKPSNKLEKSIINTIVNERNDLSLNVENYLASRLTDVYKTLF